MVAVLSPHRSSVGLAWPADVLAMANTGRVLAMAAGGVEDASASPCSRTRHFYQHHPAVQPSWEGGEAREARGREGHRIASVGKWTEQREASSQLARWRHTLTPP